MFVDIAAQNRVGQGIAVGMDFPSAENKGVLLLGGVDGIKHHGKVAAGRVFHAGREACT